MRLSKPNENENETMTVTFAPDWCAECGQNYKPKRHTMRFCSAKCRKIYNERRINEGIVIWNWIMEWRIDRPPNALSKLTWNVENFVVAERERRKKRKEHIFEQKRQEAAA
jgi:endogenous inhibitor of DNA gyrase (YacG/DUF329 family)